VRKVASSLGEIIGDIARQKHAAAVARRRPDVSADRPADVAGKCLAVVAANLGPEGYASRARGRRLVKRDGDFTYEIFFQLDRHNYAGGRVAVWTHASIGSLELRRWRTLNRMPWGGLPSSHFAGGQIGNLRLPRAWMTWDFADPTAREATIHDLIGAIRQIVFPFFAMFEDRDAVMRVFERAELLGATDAIEYAQAHFGREGANRILRSFLAKEPGVIEPFLSAVDLYRREGLPLGHNGETASALAAMAVFLALDPFGS
jgi:hypothetical protein